MAQLGIPNVLMKGSFTSLVLSSGFCGLHGSSCSPWLVAARGLQGKRPQASAFHLSISYKLPPGICAQSKLWKISSSHLPTLQSAVASLLVKTAWLPDQRLHRCVPFTGLQICSTALLQILVQLYAETGQQNSPWTMLVLRMAILSLLKRSHFALNSPLPQM